MGPSVFTEAAGYGTWAATPLRRALALLALLAAWLAASPAHALPSFAQQTGLPCSQCHSIAFGPALTAYGRQFKLNAYSLGEHKSSVPLALMAILSTTTTSTDLPEAPAEIDR